MRKKYTYFFASIFILMGRHVQTREVPLCIDVHCETREVMVMINEMMVMMCR
jgi:hypothetical protein